MVERESDGAKQYRLGVLLVHGIGMQPSGDTLMRWGDALVRTLRGGTGGRVAVAVETASVEVETSRAESSEAVLRLDWGEAEPERWLLREGWWADAFLSPSYSDLVSWSVRALPWSFGMHIAQKYWEARERSGGRIPWGAALLAGIQLLAAMAVAPLFVLLLGIALVLGLLPIPRLREAILAAQGVLTATVGDSLAFVESPVRAALIRTRVLEGLRTLASRCERTIIVAHSQGAAVVLDALGGIGTPDVREANPWGAGNPDSPHARSSPPVPDTLLTFGAGTNKLASLKALDGGLPDRVGVNPAAYAMMTMLVCAGVEAWVYAGVATRETSLADVGAALALLVVVTVFFSIAVSLIVKHLVPLLARHFGGVERDQQKAAVWLLTPLFLLTLVPLFVYAGRTGLPFASVAVLVAAVLLLLASLVTMLSRELRLAVTAAHTPPGLGRWIDIYASHDPVPNGRTWTSTDDPIESVRISNRASLFADHTTYWENSDEFALRVARACASTAGSPWASALPPDTPAIGARAEWRLGWLRLARRGVLLGWVLSGLTVWLEVGSSLPLPFAIPSWLPAGASSALPLLLLVGAVGLLIAATNALLTWIWRTWVAREQRLLLRHRPPSEREQLSLTAMATVVWAVLGILYVLSREGATATFEILRTPSAILAGAPAVLGAALTTAYVLAWLRPPPSATGAWKDAQAAADSGTAGDPPGVELP